MSRSYICPSCPYRISYAHPAGDVEEAVKQHKLAHKYPLTDDQKEKLWQSITESRSSAASA